MTDAGRAGVAPSQDGFSCPYGHIHCGGQGYCGYEQQSDGLGRLEEPESPLERTSAADGPPDRWGESDGQD